MRELIKRIMQIEGKKSSVSIGNTREILSILATILANDPEMNSAFQKYVSKKETK